MRTMQGHGAVRSPEVIRAVLHVHKQELHEITERLEADERGAISYFTSTEKEEAWADRDALSAEVATLEWVLLKSDAPAYPVEGVVLEVSNE